MKIKHVSAAVAAIVITAPAVQADPDPITPVTPIEAHQRVFAAVKAVRDMVVPQAAIHFVETFPPVAVPRKKILQLAQVEPAGVPGVPPPPPPSPAAHPAIAHPPVPPEPVMAATEAAEWANNMAMAASDHAMSAAFGGMFSGSKVRKPLVVSTTERDAKALSQIEEDLNVMMRIIEKAATSTRDEMKVMGIDVFALGGSSAPRVFYIDGYGAMFLLRVKYPLLAPPSKDEKPRAVTDTNSEWERARQEVYGRSRNEDRIFTREGPAEEFDAERVEKLKNQILDDLANATHIRDLKPDEYVTVVVSGGAAARGGAMIRTESRPGKGGATAMSGVYAVSEKGSGDASQSTMTIRARKSDIDSFAKGKLKAEEFRKKVSVQVY